MPVTPYKDQSRMTGLAGALNKAVQGQPKKIKPLQVQHTQGEMKTINHSSFSIARKGNKPKVEYDDLPRYNSSVI